MESVILEKIKAFINAQPIKCFSTTELCSKLPREQIQHIVRKYVSLTKYLDSKCETNLGLFVLERTQAGQEIFRCRCIVSNELESALYENVAQIVQKAPKTVEEIRSQLETKRDLIEYLQENFYGRLDLFASFYCGTFVVKEGAPSAVVSLKRRSRVPTMEPIRSPPCMLETEPFMADVVRQVIFALSGKGDLPFSTVGAALKDVRKSIQARGYNGLQGFFSAYSEIFSLSGEDTTNMCVSLVFATAENTFEFLEETQVYPSLVGKQSQPVGQSQHSEIQPPKVEKKEEEIRAEDILLPELGFTLVDSTEAAEAAVGSLSAYEIVGVDCEGLNKGSDICLVQITARSESDPSAPVFIFDVRQRVPGILAPLKTLLENPAITKVFHDSRLDVAGLKLLDIDAKEIVDTQVGQCLYLQLSRVACAEQRPDAATAQQDIQSLSTVLRKHCEILEMDFKETIRIRMQADPDLWRKKLDPTMLQYAAHDVIHLIDAFRKMSSKMQQHLNAIFRRASAMYGQGTLRTTDVTELLVSGHN